MIDTFAKEYLHSDLRDVRAALLWKLEGLSEYDVRRPLTRTGTNLLGLVKHLTLWESWYFGAIFDRPFPDPLPRWDDEAANAAHMWATEHETRADIITGYKRAWAHSDATIEALAIDAPGHVPWWPRPNVMLFNILVHMLTETARHAGHADILREQLDGKTGTEAVFAEQADQDAAFWQEHLPTIEAAARAVSQSGPSRGRR
jgi:hypothetical protein